MNTLDIIISIIVLLFALSGLKNGLLRSLFSLAGIIAGFFLATKYNEQITNALKFLKWEPKLIALFSFVIVILILYSVSVYISGKISRLNIVTKVIDKISGTALGIFKGLILSSLFLIVSTQTFSFFGKEEVAKSKLYPAIIEIAPAVYNYLIKFSPDAKNFYDEFNHLIFS